MQEFDWEAAVREIDSACQRAPASTSGRENVVERGSRSSKAGGYDRDPRQTTLDCFVGSRGILSNEGLRRSGCDPPGKVMDGGNKLSDDQISSVSIDLDAAKTWIYPG